MPIRVDPEGNEIRALLDFADLGGKQVIEIGSGDGRLTWRFASGAAHVTAIEPFAPSDSRARQNLPDNLKGRIQFHQVEFDEFATTAKPGAFDLAILSWSLC